MNRWPLLLTVLAVGCLHHPTPSAVPEGPSGPPGHLRFLVIDDSAGFPIEGASVTWIAAGGRSGFGGTSDMDGVVDISRVPVGATPVTFRAAEYTTRVDTITADSATGYSAVVRLRRPATRIDLVLGAASSSCRAPSERSTPAPYCALTTRPALDTIAMGADYRAVLSSAAGTREFGNSSEVAVAMIVGADGRPLVDGMRVVMQHSPRRDSVILRAARALRFTPGRDSTGPVATALTVQLVSEGFDAGIPTVPTFAQATNFRAGLRIVAGARPMPHDRDLPPLNASEVPEVRRAVIAALLPLAEADSGRVTCLDLRGREGSGLPDPQLAQAFADQGVIPVAQCPPTYTQMFARLDSLGRPLQRPPGVLDPAHLSIMTLVRWTRDVARVDVRTSVSSHGRDIRCAVYRNDPGPTWRATCSVGRRWVS